MGNLTDKGSYSGHWDQIISKAEPEVILDLHRTQKGKSDQIDLCTLMGRNPDQLSCTGHPVPHL